MNNSDVSKLLSMLSQMDKKDLEKGISQAEKILNSQDATKLKNILNQMNK